MVGFDIMANANEGILGDVVGRIGFDFFFCRGYVRSSSESGRTGSRSMFPSAAEHASISVSDSVDVDISTWLSCDMTASGGL